MSEEIKTQEEPKVEPKTEPKEEPKEPEKKYTDKDVDDIVNKKFAKWQKEAEEQKAEAEKLAQMNEAEKFKYELDKLHKENEELRKSQMRLEMNKTASLLLGEKGIESTETILNLVVTDDAETTKANIDSLVSIIGNEIKKHTLEQAKGKTPSSLPSVDKEMTRAEFDKLTYNERLELKRTKPDLYAKLLKEK